MTHHIDSTQNGGKAYIFGYDLNGENAYILGNDLSNNYFTKLASEIAKANVSRTTLENEIAQEICFRRDGDIKDLLEAKDLTACIVVPSIAATKTSLDSIKDISEKQIRNLVHYFKKAKHTKTDYEPGINYLCSLARSGEVPPSQDVHTGENLAQKIFSWEVEKKDFDKIISDLSKQRQSEIAKANVSCVKLKNEIAKEICCRRDGDIKDLLEAKDLTACIVVPSIAATKTSLDSLKDISETQIRNLVYYFTKEGNTKTDYEPGINYLCSRARSDEVPSSQDGHTEENLAQKIFSQEVEKKDFDKIISDLSKQRKEENFYYSYWELPTTCSKKISLCFAKHTLAGVAFGLGSVVVVAISADLLAPKISLDMISAISPEIAKIVKESALQFKEISAKIIIENLPAIKKLAEEIVAQNLPKIEKAMPRCTLQ